MARVARIETDRLLLREQQPSDAAAWAPHLGDPDFQRYIPVRRTADALEVRAARGFDALMQRWATEPLVAVGWVITRRSDGAVIGRGGVEAGEDPGDGEIDYFLAKPYWGQGYGREAAQAMARFALEAIPFRRLVAYIVPGNEGSIRIAEGLGLRFEREVNYLDFFPNPAEIQLANPMTGLYVADRGAVTFGTGQYRVLDGTPG
ncbi:MAG TPA: GNAT family N-acetyltransferase [Candidatus Limnocylindrales bacterium]|nr:GNAT family N-acetyltransferase [Candidatus Limnocylindrales bacterium]